jgi:hypothetical protein
LFLCQIRYNLYLKNRTNDLVDFSDNSSFIELFLNQALVTLNLFNNKQLQCASHYALLSFQTCPKYSPLVSYPGTGLGQVMHVTNIDSEIMIIVVCEQRQLRNEVVIYDAVEAFMDKLADVKGVCEVKRLEEHSCNEWQLWSG